MVASQEREEALSLENPSLDYSAIYGLQGLDRLRFTIDNNKDKPLAEINFFLGDNPRLCLSIKTRGYSNTLDDFFYLSFAGGNSFAQDGDAVETFLITDTEGNKYTLQIDLGDGKIIFLSWPIDKDDLTNLFDNLREITCPQQIPQNIAGRGKYGILEGINPEISELLLGKIDFGLIKGGQAIVSLQEGLRDISSRQR